MKPKLITPAAGIHTPLQLTAWLPGRVPTTFYGVCRTGLETSAAANNKTQPQIQNTINHIRFFNSISIKLSLHSNHRTVTRQLPASPISSPKVADAAAAILDRALREELDREITVMSRGENIASNQRREKMLGRYLLSKPYQVIQRFYGINRMHAETDRRDPVTFHEPFHNDIIHERVEQKTHSSTQAHTERVVLPAPVSAPLGSNEINHLANEVVQRVERRIKTQQERKGKW